MSASEAIGAVAANSGAAEPALSLTAAVSARPNSAADVQGVGGADFAGMLSRATAAVEARVAHADEMVRAFVVDDSIPVHEVTIALEEARIAVELALQVRTRVVESYREIMNMQL
ncbi:MAG: flagellar hook-basal body complex protein FliE [Phycisphaerales bacterium]|nr:flagellar hook-basal body complex protein FliE [Hyphomonadaceae bacterium]